MSRPGFIDMAAIDMASNDSYSAILEKDNTRLRARVSELEGINQMLLNVIKRYNTEKSVVSSKKKTAARASNTSAIQTSKKQAKIDMLTEQIQNMDNKPVSTTSVTALRNQLKQLKTKAHNEMKAKVAEEKARHRAAAALKKAQKQAAREAKQKAAAEKKAAAAFKKAQKQAKKVENSLLKQIAKMHNNQTHLVQNPED